MVKIVNDLGDIKTGRQGEAVYQRKYGKQIRRTVSPKRAIPSQRQIAHRQLYRAALDWRKSLSRDNRIYLEGYCIVNGVVDNYHIPLPWSRFALKIYLQAIKFVVITKPVAGEEGESGKFEAYEEGDNTNSIAYGNIWQGQSFTPQATHLIDRVDLKLRRYGSNMGTGYLEIYATDENGHPTGDPLTFLQFDPDAEIGTTTYWHTFNLPPYQLAEGVKYAIVLRVTGGAGDRCLQPRVDTTTAAYPGGCREETQNGGSSWTSFGGHDFVFAEWGTTKGEPAISGLLHVRHPALMTVVHKRGEETINGYDTLSSLDKKYLTGQVGLDVEAGDLIKATTLPGIEYTYEVV